MNLFAHQNLDRFERALENAYVGKYYTSISRLNSGLKVVNFSIGEELASSVGYAWDKEQRRINEMKRR